MDFDRYRDTEHWRSLAWEAQALLPYVLEMMTDGRLEVGALFSPASVVGSALPAWPAEVIEAGLAELAARKLVIPEAGALVLATAPPLRAGRKIAVDDDDPFSDPLGYRPPPLAPSLPRQANGGGLVAREGGKVTTPIQHREPYSARFLAAWKNYPRKVGKGAAWLAWLKTSRAPGMTEEALYDKVRAALKWQLPHPTYFRFDDPSRIKHMSTWLNARCFEDEEER